MLDSELELRELPLLELPELAVLADEALLAVDSDSLCVLALLSLDTEDAVLSSLMELGDD